MKPATKKTKPVIGIASYAAPAGAAATDAERTAANLEGAFGLVRQAAAAGADLVVLPELFAVQNIADWPSAAEPLDGPVLTAVAREARKHRIWIAAGHVTLEQRKRYNALVLFDRQGQRQAVYHKTYPTIWELERGIVPGPGAMTAETEFGRIGFAICYDLNFAELRLEYRDAQPNLILFSSFFRGGLQLRWWAYETRAYLVAAVLGPEGGLIDPLGRLVAQTDAMFRLAVTPANLDYAVVHLDYTNVTLDAARLKYGKAFAFECAEAEGVLLIRALGKQRVQDLLSEFGWETVESYFQRARKARDRVRAGRRLPIGPPPFAS